MIIKSILIWSLMIPLAILNGALRVGLIEPIIGEIYANPISCVILCLLIFIVSFIFIPKLGNGIKVVYIKIGILWVLLTIIFETILGLFMGNTINEVIMAYNIATGNFWLIVVIFIGFAPLLIAKIKKII